MLAMDPCDRITVEDALRHPYLADLHDPDDEPTASPFEEELQVISIGLGSSPPSRLKCLHCRAGEDLVPDLWQDSFLGAASTY